MKSKHTAPPAASAPAAKDTARSSTPAESEKSGSSGNGLTLVAIALGLAGIGGAWYNHSTLSTQLNGLQQDVGARLDASSTETGESLTALGETLTAQLDAIGERTTALESTGDALGSKTAELEERAGELGSALEETRNSVQTNSDTLQKTSEELLASIASGNAELGEKLQSRSEELASAMESRTSALDALLETRSNEITGLVEARTGELNDSLQETQMKINRNQRAWLLSEIEYLLRTSVHRVVLAGDTNSAVEALKAAKEQLKVLAEVEYLPVQRAISAEITELRSASQPDIEQLIIDIRELSRSASDLRMPGSDEPAVAQETGETETAETSEPASEDDSGLGKLASSLLDGLKKNVSIKTSGGQQYGSQQDGIFAPTEEESTNAELVRLNLQAAQLSAMRRDQDGFDTHMGNARNRVQSLFDVEHADTQSFINQLDLLAELSVVPHAEQLGNSLRLLVETNQKIGDQS